MCLYILLPLLVQTLSRFRTSEGETPARLFYGFRNSKCFPENRAAAHLVQWGEPWQLPVVTNSPLTSSAAKKADKCTAPLERLL